jgi:FAD/FMN-containing dehydrogenase
VSKPAAAAVSIPQLRAELDGQVIAPDDPEYDQARTVFYGGFDRRPAVIVQPVDVSGIQRVISLARDAGLELAVRSGGHSLVGHSVSDGGIVLDLANLRSMEVDVDQRTAWVEPGLTTGEYTNAAAEHGLATGFGDTGSVGIGGITLGGGVGFLVRKYGLTIDSLLAADVVTADGQLLHVDAETHPDLFWAIRGGGGNFGVATRFKFRLHEVGTIVGGMLLLPATPEVIASFVAEAEAAPDELSTIANVMPAPPMPFVPEEHHGKLVLIALMVYAGDAEAGERVIAPFRALATPLADMIKPMPYPEIFFPEEEGYHPIAVSRTMFVDSVYHGVAQTIVDHLEASTAPLRAAQVRVLGGVMARIPAEATAFSHRQSRIMVNVAAVFENPDERMVHEPWVTDFAAALQQDDAGAYVGFLADDGAARIHDAYPGDTWDRLVQIKARYDPSNLFRLNHNIAPIGQG